MKTVDLPRDLSHVVRDGMRFCVLCEHACVKASRCPCCNPFAVRPGDREDPASAA